MEETTLCYLTCKNQVLMLHRVKKDHDINAGKWIGVGGHLEAGETPIMCARREIYEETGLFVQKLRLRGIVDFFSGKDLGEHMYLYTGEVDSMEVRECNEGVLHWFPKRDILQLNLWEGDRIFLRYLAEDRPFFHLSLHYEGDRLVSSKLYPRVILASQSPRRRELLAQVGIFPEIMPSSADETSDVTDPRELVQLLSRRKASSVLSDLCLKSGRIENEGSAGSLLSETLYIIAADTVVSTAGRVLGKPKTHEEAFHMVKSLSGSVHQVYTGVTVIRADPTPASSSASLEQGGEENATEARGVISPEDPAVSMESRTFFNETQVRVVSMTEQEIREYADSSEPMDKAGAYGIQGSFAAYVEGILGDYTNVVGLPVAHTVKTLKELGYRKIKPYKTG